MVAPPVHDFDGVFQTMVVSEASTSPAAFSRTVPSPPMQRTNSRPPSAPLTSQWASANSSAWMQSTANAKPFWASHSRPPEVAAMPSRPSIRATRAAGGGHRSPLGRGEPGPASARVGRGAANTDRVPGDRGAAAAASRPPRWTSEAK